VLVRARNGHFMDKPDNVISLINLATVRSLEARWGVRIDPLRFRANIYVDNVAPWAEFDWIGHDVRIGDCVFAVDRKNGRCGATNVDPATGQRDLDIPGSLRTAFGHKNLGVYLMAREAGEIAVGDALAARGVLKAPPAAKPLAGSLEPSPRRFICAGCYFIYDEEAGLPQQGFAPGTPFAAIPESWPCADCGSPKSLFRAHAPTTAG
jgi:GntR family transcriptional regulator/MocR family aminotransferase